MLARIPAIHQASRGPYGAPRIHRELRAAGVHVGRKRVARLMRAAGLQGVSRRKAPRTTVRAARAQPAPDLVRREFTTTQPNQLWVAAITYIPTGAGVLYLAVVLDVWSRRIVGWAMATHLRTALVLAALEMAIQQRRPAGVIPYSDQGRQYTAVDFGTRCKAAGVRPSMGSVGDCYDNALCESFFATLECELLDRMHFPTPAAARAEVFTFIEGWYNPHRRHSALDYDSPLAFEQRQLGPGPRAAEAPSAPEDRNLRDLTGYRDGKWRFAHAAQIRTEHGYRDLADRAAGFGLTRWLYAQCWTGTERPSALFDRATTWMLAHKVLLPGATTLERFVAKLRHRVDVRVWRVLASGISPPQQRRLEDLLRVPCTWCKRVGRNSAAHHS